MGVTVMAVAATRGFVTKQFNQRFLDSATETWDIMRNATQRNITKADTNSLWNTLIASCSFDVGFVLQLGCPITCSTTNGTIIRVEPTHRICTNSAGKSEYS